MVIEGVSKMLRRLIREDIELCIRLASDLPLITADAAQTEQVIVNLAINARDAMSAGGRLTIVTQSGGHILVDSRVGAGTTFTIHFPASTASVATMKSLPVLRPTVAAVETILLVEDEHGLRKLMKELLGAEGYTVIESDNGASAIETAKMYSGTIHLLLTDMIMPRMHGRNLTMQLRQQRPGLKVLYITGHHDPGTLEGARVLEKPFLPEALLREVRHVLSTPDI